MFIYFVITFWGLESEFKLLDHFHFHLFSRFGLFWVAYHCHLHHYRASWEHCWRGWFEIERPDSDICSKPRLLQHHHYHHHHQHHQQHHHWHYHHQPHHQHQHKYHKKDQTLISVLSPVCFSVISLMLVIIIFVVPISITIIIIFTTIIISITTIVFSLIMMMIRRGGIWF